MPVVTVRYFAALREWKRCETEQVEVGAEETVGELYARLFPPGPLGTLPVAFARNLEYASPGTRMEEGDEIAFLPPLGGG
jgi:molybdopterin converting factor small subunit